MARHNRLYRRPAPPTDIRSEHEMVLYAQQADEHLQVKNHAEDVHTIAYLDDITGGGEAIEWADVGSNLPVTSPGHIILWSGTAEPQRSKLNFVGSDVTIIDSPSLDQTIVNISAPVVPAGIRFDQENDGGYLHVHTNAGGIHFTDETSTAVGGNGMTFNAIGGIFFKTGLDMELVASDHDSGNPNLGQIALHSWGDLENSGVKMWLEHVGSSVSVFGSKNKIVITRSSSEGDTGDPVMQIEFNADGSGLKYRIKGGYAWVADL